MTVSHARWTLLAPILLSACAGDPPRIPVAKRWSDSIQQYNLLPIYPMQEDVQIGDVFLYVPRLENTADAPPAVWLNRISSSNPTSIYQALRDTYCTRYRLQPAGTTATPAPGGATPAPTPAPVPAGTGATITTSITAGGTTRTDTITTSAQAAVQPAPKSPAPTPTPTPAPPADFATRCQPTPAPAGTKPPSFPYDIQQQGATSDLRLRRVELPEISVASVSDIELGAAAPISSFLAKLGLGASSAVGLDISLTDIEEVHLPFDVEIQQLRKLEEGLAAKQFTPSVFLEYISQKRPDLLPAACFPDLKTLNDSKMQVMVANEVVYAHAISYAYKSSSTLAGQLGVSLAAATAKPATPSPAPAPAPAPAAAPAAPVTATDPVTATQGLLTAEAAKVAGLTGSLTGAGGTLQFGVGRSGNLTLSDKFPQPMAFGIGDLLEFAPTDLLWLYRKSYLTPMVPANRQALDEDLQYIGLICDGQTPPPGKSATSLVSYITNPDTSTIMALVPPPPGPTPRIIPTSGLPPR